MAGLPDNFGKESAMPTIKNPIEWSGAQFVSAAHAATRFQHSLHHISETIHSPMPVIRRISTRDVWDALKNGFEDFEAYRSDVIFLCATYAIVGLVIFRLAMGSDLLPLLFPLASGFAIIGPLAAVGLYEMSRRREQGAEVSWVNAFDVLQAPAFGAIAVLGLALIGTFLAWLGAAWAIFHFTLGTAPADIVPFLHSIFFTPAGIAMLVAGMGVGFWFALFAMMLSVVSFPLLVDRDVGLDTAVKSSFRAVMENPKPMALWGLLVAAILAAGTAFAFVGLMVAVPVLGHATWHLYRRLVAEA
jgi:uncharacterized membrane protein